MYALPQQSFGRGRRKEKRKEGLLVSARRPLGLLFPLCMLPPPPFLSSCPLSHSSLTHSSSRSVDTLRIHLLINPSSPPPAHVLSQRCRRLLFLTHILHEYKASNQNDRALPFSAPENQPLITSLPVLFNARPVSRPSPQFVQSALIM